MKIRLTIVEKIESKLNFFKILKDVSVLGFKEFKDIVDYLCEDIGKTKEVDIKVEFMDQTVKLLDSIRYLNDEITHFGGKILLNGRSQ